MKTMTTMIVVAAATVAAHCETVLESVQNLEAEAATLNASLEATQVPAPTSPDLKDYKMLEQKVKAMAAKRDRLRAACSAAFGEDWRTHWGAGNTCANPDDVLVDLYVSGNGFPGAWFKRELSQPKVVALLDHIATKEFLTAVDKQVVEVISAGNRTIVAAHPGLASRTEQLAAFLPSKGVHGEEYYKFRNLVVLGREPADGKWQSTMKTAEWLDLATSNAHFSVETFIVGRDHLLLRAAKFFTDRRSDAGLSTEGPEFEAAIAPVLATFRAPKFQGLRDAASDLGINTNLPAQIDWSRQEAIAAAVTSAAERKGKFLTPWGAEVPYEQGLGSVMLVKGAVAYQAWRDALEAND